MLTCPSLQDSEHAVCGPAPSGALCCEARSPGDGSCTGASNQGFSPANSSGCRGD